MPVPDRAEKIYCAITGTCRILKSMNKEIIAKLKYICGKFDLPGDLVVHFSWVPKGHVNTAYRITLEDGETEKQFLVQKVNWFVYRDPVSVMHNIELITQHLTEKGQRSLHYYRTGTGDPYLILREDGRSFIALEDLPQEQRAEELTDAPWEAGWEFWRVADFVENTITFESAEAEEKVVKKAGAAFGGFVRLLSDFDTGLLSDSVPHFHDTPYRFESLIGMLAFDPLGRAAELSEEKEFILRYRDFAGTLNRSGLPVRVTHNDTKLNNILFDKDTLEPLVIIDLDTCMPGLACYDFGDSIRFAACTADNKLDLALFRAYTEGYLSEMKDVLTGEEIGSLAPGAAVITLELVCRYLEDYLIGDKYFRAEHPKQNLERARARLELFRDMMEHMDEMKRIVKEVSR